MSARSTGAAAGAAAAGTLAARVASIVLSIGAGIIVARFLGAEGKGAYSGVQMLLALPVAALGGAGAAITFALTRQRASVRDIFPTLAFVLSGAALLTWSGALVYGLLRGWNIEIVVFALIVPPSIVLAWQPSYYVATAQIRRLNLQTVALALAVLIGIFCAVRLFDRGIAGVLVAWLVCTYLAAAVVIIDMIRHGGRLHRRDFRKQLAGFMNIGGQSGVNALLGTLNYRVDSFILIGLLGLAPFGIYSVGVAVGQTLFLLSRSVTTAISREIGAADLERSALVTARTIRISCTLVAACACVIFFAAPPLINALYGHAFASASAPLRALLPGIVIFASAGTFATFFTLQLGRPGVVSAINVLMIAAQAAACFVLVPRFGMVGAAAASSVTYFIGAAANTIYFCRQTGVRPADVWIVRAHDLERIFAIASELAPRLRSRTTRKQRESVVTISQANRIGVRHMRRRIAGAKTVIVSRDALFAQTRGVLEPIRRYYVILEAARAEGVAEVVFPEFSRTASGDTEAVAVECQALKALYSGKYGLAVT